MLVLERDLNESIIVPELDLEIQILAIKRNKVRLGISAPTSIRILRKELLDGEKRIPTTSPQV